MRQAVAQAGHKSIQKSVDIRWFVVDYGVDILVQSGNHRTIISCRHAWWYNELILMDVNRGGDVAEKSSR